MSKIRILVVDDSRVIRLQLGLTLRTAGYDVVEAHDGLEGLNKLATDRSIRAVICDYNMPRMNGLDLLRDVKSEPSGANIPFLMLSAGGCKELVDQARDFGAVGWMVKPFDARRLLDVLAGLLAQRRAA